MMMNAQAKKQLAAATILTLVFASPLFAEQSESLLNFKFKHLSNLQSNNSVADIVPGTNDRSLSFAQYDATWTYPWETKNMNIDLGVTLRHLSGYQRSTETSSNNYFQKFIPLLHASALYSLPVKGLSAGIEGSHLYLKDHQIFDYRAKVSYEWREGFGLQGGWQHQQFNLDGSSNVGSEYQSTGPFLDFYLNF